MNRIQQAPMRPKLPPTRRVDLSKIDLNLLLTFDVLMRERSVTRAAALLHRTPSAVSHALARLREQLNDPLLAKVPGGMAASVYAEGVAQDVRRVLALIERVLNPARPFDPATDERHWRLLLPDFVAPWFARFAGSMTREAPRATFEWLVPGDDALLRVAEGRAELALLPLSLQRPEGLQVELLAELPWACGMRRGHRAAKRWNLQAWRAASHAMVRIGDRLHSPVGHASRAMQMERHVSVTVPNFAAVGGVLRHSDLVTTLPRVALQALADAHGLVVKPVPFALAAVPFGIFWSTRFGSDEATAWLRASIRTSFCPWLERGGEGEPG